MARLRLIPEVLHHSAVENSALKALANRSPRLQIKPTLTEGAPTAPVSIIKPSQVVTGVGLSTALEEALTQRVTDWLTLEHRMQAAKAMKSDLAGSVSDIRQRQEITRRFWRLWMEKHEDRPTLTLKLRKSFAVGTVRQWSDGKSYKKVAAGKWEPAESLPKKAMGLKLPEKGIAHETVTSGASIVQKIVKNSPPSYDQAHGDLDKLFADAVAVQPTFKKLIDGIGKSTSANETLHGPLKKRARAEQKISTTYGGDAKKLNDLVRASLSYGKVSDVYRALDKLSNTKGVEIVLIKDRIAKPIAGGYRDVSLKVKVGGHVAELQLHLSSILKAKQTAHKLYEEVRTIAVKTKGEGRTKFSLREMKRIATLTKRSEKIYGDAFRIAK